MLHPSSWTERLTEYIIKPIYAHGETQGMVLGLMGVVVVAARWEVLVVIDTVAHG